MKSINFVVPLLVDAGQLMLVYLSLVSWRPGRHGAVLTNSCEPPASQSSSHLQPTHINIPTIKIASSRYCAKSVILEHSEFFQMIRTNILIKFV